jgi:hypothetical protein
MIRIAKLPPQERADLFLLAATSMGVTPAILEKDFWVCFILEYLFQRSPMQRRLVFKGGTSLSKCYHLIARFSEDVDLILDWRELGYSLSEPWEERSNTKQEQFKQDCLARTNSYLRDVFVPTVQHDLSVELGSPVTLYPAREEETVFFEYPHEFNPSSTLGYIRLEIGPLAAWTPTESANIRSYLSEQIPQLILNATFPVKTVKPERTFWEKATILHQEANRPESKTMLSRYSRHYYDLYKMSQSFVKDNALGDMHLLEKVVRFKEKFYRTPWSKLSDAKSGSFRLVPSGYRIRELNRDFEAMKEMFIGEAPSFQQILAGLHELEQEINS